MPADELDENAQYSAFPFDYYVLNHWAEDTPEESHQQWERLVWEYQKLSLIERYSYYRRAHPVVAQISPSELTEEQVQILRPHQTIYERNLSTAKDAGIQTVWLRTCYDEDLVEKYEDMRGYAEVTGDKFLDNSTRYAFDDGSADHWRRVLVRMPGITDFSGISDNEGDGRILVYRSGLNDHEIRTECEQLEDEGLKTLSLKQLEFQAVLYLLDREAIETSDQDSLVG